MWEEIWGWKLGRGTPRAPRNWCLPSAHSTLDRAETGAILSAQQGQRCTFGIKRYLGNI